MRQYEIVTIYRNSEQGQLETTRKAVGELLARHKAEVVKEDEWGNRSLWHETRDALSGFFILVTCKMPPESIKDLKHDLEIQNGLLRFMVKRAA